jgi:hypothetical protein
MRQYVLPHFEPKESHKFSPEFISVGEGPPLHRQFSNDEALSLFSGRRFPCRSKHCNEIVMMQGSEHFRDRSGDLIVAPLIDTTTTNPPISTNGPGSITDPNDNMLSTSGSSFTDTLGL